jgi:hypothetical protein
VTGWPWFCKSLGRYSGGRGNRGTVFMDEVDGCLAKRGCSFGGEEAYVPNRARLYKATEYLPTFQSRIICSRYKQDVVAIAGDLDLHLLALMH